MKLLLPKGLYIALRASVLSTTALLTTVAAVATLAPLAQATDTTYIYTGNGGNITTAGSLGFVNAEDVWTIYSYAAGDWFGGSSAARNNVIRFVSADTYLALSGSAIGSGQSIGIDAGTMNLGGFTVDAGATGFNYVAPSSTSDRNIFIQGINSTDNTSAAEFKINENFTFRNASTSTSAIGRNFSLVADANVTVATGKTFTVSGNWANGAGKTLSLSGGGTMLYTDTGSATATAASFDWNISGGSTLRLNGSNISNGNAVLGSGTVSLSGDSTILIDVDGSVLTGDFAVGVGGALITGVNTTLSGSLTYSDYLNDLLTIDGSFTLGELTLDLGLDSVGNGDYTIMRRADDTSTFSTDLGSLTILGVDGLKNTSFSWVDNNLVLTITDFTGNQLTWTGGSDTWSTSPEGTGWGGGPYSQGDIVTFENDVAGTTDAITIEGLLSPSDVITVSGAGNTAFSPADLDSTNNQIVGSVSLEKNGSGELRINGTNSYSGGTTLNAGTLAISDMDAIGTGSLEINGGTLRLFGEGTVAIDGARVALADGVRFNIDLEDVDASVSNAIANHALNLTGSGTLTSSWDKVTSVNVGAGATAYFNAADTQNAQYKAIFGAGTITYAGGTDYDRFTVRFDSNVAFTGTLNMNSGNNGAMDITNSNESSRMTLNLLGNSNLAIASSNNGDTLYLKELTGSGTLRYDFNVSSDTVKNVDLELSASSTFAGTILYNAARTGAFNVSAANSNARFTFSGAGMTGSTDSETIGLLNISNTVVWLTNNAQWNGRINLADNAVIVFSNTGEDVVIRGAAMGQITGEGIVAINAANGVRFDRANSYSGNTDIAPGAELQLGNDQALGTSTLRATAGASLVLGDGVSIGNNLLIGGILDLSSEGSSTLTGSIVSTASADEASDSINITSGNVSIVGNQDLSQFNIAVEAGASLSVQGGIIDYSKLTVAEGAMIGLNSSTLTSLTVNDAGLKDFTTSQGMTSESRVYEIMGLTNDVFASVTGGSLTLDLGNLASFDEGIITALQLVGVDSLAGLNPTNIEFIINGTTYESFGFTQPGGVGTDIFLYIPEPSTATLSLMALAGLLARRRRKTA